MINLRYIILLAYMALSPAIAAEPSASEASVRELLVITQSKKLLDGAMGQLDAMMQNAMKQAFADQTLTADSRSSQMTCARRYSRCSRRT